MQIINNNCLKMCTYKPCFGYEHSSVLLDHLIGVVVKVSASRAEDPEFESRLHQDFSGSSHTSDLKIGTPVATLPGAWHYRVSAGTGRPGVSVSVYCDWVRWKV